MRDDATAGQVIIDDRRVNEPFRDDSGFDKRIDDQIKDPIRNGINLAFRIKPFVSGSTFFHLTSVNITLAKKVSENPQIEICHYMMITYCHERHVLVR